MKSGNMKTEIRILYFASLAELFECDEESLELGASAISCSQLKVQLAARGPAWKALLEASTRCAVNQSIVIDDFQIYADDEVAFFPPVTGG